MIRHELLTSTVRLYSTEPTNPFQPYDAICTVVWETPEVVWIKGMTGDISQQHWTDIHDFLYGIGVRTVKVHVNATIQVPFQGTQDGDIITFGPAYIPKIQSIRCVGGVQYYGTLRHTINTSVLRFYVDLSAGWFDQYDAICTFQWETPVVVWMVGMHGTMTRRMLRELVVLFVENSIQTVKAHRAPDRTLPFITSRDGTYVEIDVASVVKRLSPKSPQD